jgi:hypothetical protein
MHPHSVPQIAQWAILALVLNLLWEVAQLTFYSFAPTVGPLAIAWDVIHCTAGDVGIALLSFGAATLATRNIRWPDDRPWFGLAIALAVGFVWTIQSEWKNVYVSGAWAYAQTMPTIAGVGLLPLLQWLVLPPLALVVMRQWKRANASAIEGEIWTASRKATP